MSILSLFTDLFRNLNQQRLRSFLTIFGIMWGTATLILLLAFGVGFRDQTVLNMRGMGDQLAIMFPGKTTKAFEGYGVGPSDSISRIGCLDVEAANSGNRYCIA